MDSSTVILIVALVLSIAAGPALGFAWARRRLAAKDRMRADRSARFTNLDDSLRHLSSSAYAPPERTEGSAAVGPQSAAYPDGRGAVGTGTPGAAPLGTSLAQRTGTRGAAHPLASRRFDFEPPVFGEAPTSQPPADRGYPTPQSPFSGEAPTSKPPADRGYPTPQSPFFEDAPTPEPHFSTSPAPGTAVGPPDEPAPPEAPGPSMSTYGSPSFRPIADIVDEAITDRLSWLERLSTGRLLRLHQLGYDDPVKIANLRPAEVTRLARALQVTEDEILTEWIPAARKELGMRLATSHSGSATKA